MVFETAGEDALPGAVESRSDSVSGARLYPLAVEFEREGFWVAQFKLAPRKKKSRRFVVVSQ